MRIVSLLPGATEIVHRLGLSPYQVGRSHECDYPPGVASLPVCTAPKLPLSGSSRDIDRSVKDSVRSALSVYEVFADVLQRLQPTHILTQSQCEVCAVSPREVERALEAAILSRPRLISLSATSLAGVWEDIRRVAEACDVGARGVALGDTLEAQMREIAERAQSAGTPPRVACLEWLEPLMGAGDWIPELVERAGGISVAGEAGQPAAWIPWEDLVSREPDVIVAAPCGLDLRRTREEMRWLTARPDWARLRAVGTGRVYVVDGHQYCNRRGPRLVDSLEILAAILHPERFPPAREGTGWQKL